MSDPQKDAFRDRIARIEKQHRKAGGPPAARGLARGTERRRGRIPYKTLLLAIVAFAALKVFLVLRQGEDAYAAAVAEARQGEDARAWAALLFAPDPATLALARSLRPHVADTMGWPE